MAEDQSSIRLGLQRVPEPWTAGGLLPLPARPVVQAYGRPGRL